MYDQNENPELKYAQKFERFENNPYASDGWDDIAAEYQDLGKDEQMEVIKTVERENSPQEITHDTFAEALSQYSEAREHDEQLKRNHIQDSIALLEIRKNSELLEAGADNIDATFVRRQIETFELNRSENLKSISPVENGGKVIGRFGEFRDANAAEIAESERLSKLAQSPEDENLFRNKEKYLFSLEKKAERAEKMQQEELRYKNPNIFDRAVDAIPVFGWDREEKFHERIHEFSEPTEEEKEIARENPHLEEKVEAQIESGDWRNIDAV